MKTNSYLIVILILIGTLILQRECSRNVQISLPSAPTVNKEYIYDTTVVVIEVEIPVPIETIDTVWQYHNVDTAAILADYFRLRIYQDTLVNNSDLLFVLRDTVHQNKLLNREVSYINYRPIDVECIELPYRPKFFIGGQVLGSPNQFGAGPSIAYLSNRNSLYSYQWDAVNNTHGISMYWNLRFKR